MSEHLGEIGGLVSRFVDDSRLAVVSHILQRLKSIQGGGDQPRLIILVGSSGAGKSRIVREVYSRLRSENRDEYWPALPEPNARHDTFSLGDRKKLGPPIDGFVWPESSLPTFSWWELQCDTGTNSSTLGLVDSLTRTLKWHGLALAARHDAHASMGTEQEGRWKGWWRKQKRWALDVQLALPHMLDSLVSDSVDLVTGGLPAGLSTFAAMAAELDADVANRRHQRALVHDEVIFGETEELKRSNAITQAQGLRSFARPYLPAVVAVEDLQLADPAALAFLTELGQVEPDRPTMVLATVWPEGLSDDAVGSWVRARIADGTAETIRIGDLSPEARVDIVLQHYPACDPDLAGEIARRWVHPLSLELFLTDPEVIRWHAGGSDKNRHLSLDVSDLPNYPTNVESLYLRRWEALDSRVQRALRYAAYSNGRTLHEAGVEQFIPEVLGTAAEQSQDQRLGDPTDLSLGLGEAVSIDWLRACLDAPEVGRKFAEPLLAATARRDLPESVQRELLRLVNLSLVRGINTARNNGYVMDISDPMNRLLSEWLVRLDLSESTSRDAQDSSQFERSTVVMDIDGVLADTLHRQHHLDHRYPNWKGFFSAAGLDPPIQEGIDFATQIVRSGGRVVFLTGRPERLRDVTTRWLADHGLPADKECLLMRGDHDRRNESAFKVSALRSISTREPLREYWDDDPAIVASARFAGIPAKFAPWSQPRGVSGRDPIADALRRTFIAEAGIPPTVYQSRRRRGARGRRSKPMTMPVSNGDSDLPDRHSKRTEVPEPDPTFPPAWAPRRRRPRRRRPDRRPTSLGPTSDADSTDDHSRQREQAQPTADRAHGAPPQPPEALARSIALCHVARVLAQARRDSDAIDMFKSPRAIEALPEHHPDTLRLRFDLAQSLLRDGRTEEAITELQSLVRTQQEVLGLGHADTLESTQSLSDALLQSIKMYEYIFGPRAAANRRIRILDELQALATQQARILGPDHVATQATRRKLATLLLTEGRPEEATAHLRSLLSDQEATLGSQHGNTVSTRRMLAQVLEFAGQTDQAIELFSCNFDALKAKHGAHHPETTHAQHLLAFALLHAGHEEESLTLMLPLLNTIERDFGPDDSRAQRIRRAMRGTLSQETNNSD